ncbi:MAG: carbon-nitrogen family hydrolase [Lachnospiraceae bacterium]|nr:carbon-nitrogen family hydrolase [Lachnospiraceae bacterium]
MKVALTQMDIVWEDPERNRTTCATLVQQAADASCDLIIFPEMTLTGFTMSPEHFYPNDDIGFFRSLASQHTITIAFGYIAKEDAFQNRLAIIDAQGNLLMDYAKLHPFTYGEETVHYTGGSRVQSVTWGQSIVPNSFMIGISGFICYDLRFPEIFQIASKQATIILLIANWPESRIDHWYTLLKARAIENQCYMLGVNRVGDGNGIHYIPSSAAYDPYGKLLTPEHCADSILYAEIDPAVALSYRESFPLKADRRSDLYEN